MGSDRLREPNNTHTHVPMYMCAREQDSAFKTRKRLEAPPQRSHCCCLCRCLLTMFGEGSLGVDKRDGGTGEGAYTQKLSRAGWQRPLTRRTDRQTERRRERDCKTDSEDSEVNAERQRS